MWWYPVAFISIALALLPWPLMMRAAALMTLIPLAAVTDRAPDPGALDITILDTGGELSLVLRTHRHVLVYGTGDGYGTAGRRAEAVLVPFLRHEGVRAIDALLLPPASPEAGDGVTALFAALPVAQTFVGDGRSCEPGAWTWDGIAFDLAHACTLTVSTGGGRVLAPADPAVAGSVLVEGPSGQWIVVSGRRKTHRFTRVSVLMTNEAGAARFQMDPHGVLSAPALQRADRRRLWNASP
jgi:competence protein ComEC